jgi:hypothetical protein
MLLHKKFAVLFFLLSPMFAIARNIPTSEANAHIGEQATVCGKVADTHTASSARGMPTFLDFEKPYPNQTFSAVIWQSEKSSVGDVPRTGVLCVSGTITTYRQHPQIVLHSSSEWSIPETRSNEPPASVKPQATLSNDNHYTNSDGQVVHSPAYSSGGVPAGATAQCADGTYSFSQHRQGTCSHHGGVARWL